MAPDDAVDSSVGEAAGDTGRHMDWGLGCWMYRLGMAGDSTMVLGHVPHEDRETVG